MIFRPAQLGMAKLDRLELEADKKACRKIGPCGVGKKALYLNSFYIDRRYYLPYGSISRVFKRVAMSSGGFTGKGMFASMAYLVVEYDGGKQKQCNFKDERDVDKLLEVLAKEQPQIPLLSEAGEQALQKKEAEKAARKLPELTDEAKHSVTVLRKAKEYLEEKPELAEELSAAERRKRAQLRPVCGDEPCRQLRHLLCLVWLCGHLPVLQLQHAAHGPQQQQCHHEARRQGGSGHGGVCKALPQWCFPSAQLLRPSHRAQADDRRH